VNVVEAGFAHWHELLWAWGAIAAAAVALRLLPLLPRRTLRLAWVLLVLALASGAAAVLADGGSPLAHAGMTAALGLGSLAAIQVGAAWIFDALLPAAGLRAPRIAQDLTVTALSLAGGLVWLRLSGVDPAQLFTTSALITAVLAFSMQDTLGNVLGGVALQLDNSLRVGDWVRMDGVDGRVADVRWRYTAVETRSRELVIIPNSWLMKNRFQVVRPPADGPLAWRRAVSFMVEAQAAPAAVIRVLEAAVADAQIEHVLAQPGPSAILSDIGAGWCRYTLRYWLGEPRHDDPADSAVRMHALAALARAGMRLGVPLEERLTIKEGPTWRAAAEERDREQRLDAIRRTELFAHLPAQEQEMLAGHLERAPFAAGDIMTRQGAVAHWLYLVIHGQADVLVDGPQGRVQLATLRDGDVFGEMGMLTGEPRGATVIAVTAVDCFRLDKEGFAQLLQIRPEVAREISAIVQARNTQREERLAQAGASGRGSDDLVARIAKFFSIHL